MNKRYSRIKFFLLGCLVMSLLLSGYAFIIYRSNNSFESTIPIYAIIFSIMAFGTTITSVVLDANGKRVSSIENRLEKFYKPLQKVLTHAYDLNFDLNSMVINLSEMKQYDHLAHPELRKLFRECNVRKNVDENLLREKIIDLRKKVNSEIKLCEIKLDNND